MPSGVGPIILGAGAGAAFFEVCRYAGCNWLQAVKPNFKDPKKSPGKGWEWRGRGPKGSQQGSWYNPKTGESLHPDLNHPGPIGPHYDWKAPDGKTYRVFPDGRVESK